MNTDELIDRLVADARPVRRLLDPSERAALWVSLALVCVAVGLTYFGVRQDIGDAWRHTGLAVRIVLLACTMWLSVVTAFRLAVPGRDTRAFARWWPLIALGVLVGIAAGETVSVALVGDVGSPLRAWACVRKVAFVGTLPAIAAIVLIQRGAAIEARWTGLLGVLAAGAAGALTAELACPIRAPLHVMLWHVMPVVLSTVLGTVVGGLLLNRRARLR